MQIFHWVTFETYFRLLVSFSLSCFVAFVSHRDYDSHATQPKICINATLPLRHRRYAWKWNSWTSETLNSLARSLASNFRRETLDDRQSQSQRKGSGRDHVILNFRVNRIHSTESFYLKFYTHNSSYYARVGDEFEIEFERTSHIHSALPTCNSELKIYGRVESVRAIAWQCWAHLPFTLSRLSAWAKQRMRKQNFSIRHQHVDGFES